MEIAFSQQFSHWDENIWVLFLNSTPWLFPPWYLIYFQVPSEKSFFYVFSNIVKYGGRLWLNLIKLWICYKMILWFSLVSGQCNTKSCWSWQASWLVLHPACIWGCSHCTAVQGKSSAVHRGPLFCHKSLDCALRVSHFWLSHNLYHCSV